MSSTRSTVGAKLLWVIHNFSRPQREDDRFDFETGKMVPGQISRNKKLAKPTECLFQTDDGSLKWVVVNAGVFRGRWYKFGKDKSHLVFPPFPAGSWNVGQVRRCEDGEVRLVNMSEKPLVGIKNVWHPTIIDFAEFELLGQFGKGNGARVWHAKHPRFPEQRLMVKIEPWTNKTTLEGAETDARVYQLLEGLNMAPKFLGHVRCQGAVIGYVLEYPKGKTATRYEDRLKALEKLHAMGIAHGIPLPGNFVQRGEDTLMINFQSCKFGVDATDYRKRRDISRVGGDASCTQEDRDDEGFQAAQLYEFKSPFFKDLVDDEIDWTDDSTDDESDLDELCQDSEDSEDEF